jgi:hypothetical protein
LPVFRALPHVFIVVLSIINHSPSKLHTGMSYHYQFSKSNPLECSGEMCAALASLFKANAQAMASVKAAHGNRCFVRSSQPHPPARDRVATGVRLRLRCVVIAFRLCAIALRLACDCDCVAIVFRLRLRLCWIALRLHCVVLAITISIALHCDVFTIAIAKQLPLLLLRLRCHCNKLV